MLDGYRMTEREFEEEELRGLRSADAPAMDAERWDFGSVAALIKSPSARYTRQLSAAHHRFFRDLAMILPGRAKPMWVLAGIAAVALIAVIAWRHAAIGDVLDDHWSAWAVLTAIAVPIVLLALYAGMGARSPWIRYPLAILVMPFA